MNRRSFRRAAAAAFTASLLIACHQSQEAQDVPYRQVTGVVRSMRFVRHPQAPDLCIGYVFVEDGMDDSRVGGPGLIEVDCAKVEHLLQPAEVPPPKTAP